MIYGELKKIWGNKCLRLIMCAMLLANLVLFSRCERAGTYANSLTYTECIQKIVETAKYKIEEYRERGYSESSFVCIYQKNVIAKYSPLKNLKIELQSSDDWQLLFFYNGGGFFIIICAFLCGFYIFFSDRYCGTIYIVRTTPNGRLITGLIKMIVSHICSIIITLLFATTEIAYFVFTHKCNNFNALIQTVSGMEMCPFMLNVIEGVAIRYLVYLLCVTTIMQFACLLTALLNNCVMIYACGIIAVGSQYVLATTSFLDQSGFFYIVNLFKVLNFDFMRSYSAVRVMGRCVSTEKILTYIVIALFLLFTTMAVLFFSLRHYVLRKKKGGKSNISIFRSERKSKNTFLTYTYSSIFRHEMLKNYFKPIAIVMIVGYIVVHLFDSNMSFYGDQSYLDNQYREYARILEGELNEEKERYINQKLEYSDEIIEKEELMSVKYAQGEITREAYNDYRIDYYRCLDELPVLQRVNEQYYRCVSLREMGYDAVFMYDTGWQIYFTRNTDYILIIDLILLLAGIFSNEAESGILPILRSTAHGRIELLLKKYGVGILGCFIGWFVSEIVSIVFCLINFYLPKWDAQICSVNLGLKESSLTVYQYVTVILLNHLFGYIVLGVVIVSLSIMTENTYAVIIVGGILYLANGILRYLSVEIKFTPDIFMSCESIYVTTYLIWLFVMLFLFTISIAKYSDNMRI